MEVSFIDLQFCIKVILQHKINQRWNPLKYKCPYIRQPWYLKEFAIFLNDRIDFLLKTKIHIMKLVRFEIFISLKQRPCYKDTSKTENIFIPRRHIVNF